MPFQFDFSLKTIDEHIKSLIKEPFSLKSFFKKNKYGIYSTLIFHLLIFIVLIGIKLHSYSEINELGLIMDFDYKYQEEEKEPLTPEEEARLKLFEKFLEQSLRQSNQAVNISGQLEKQISTNNFVEQVKHELDKNRSIEEKQELEELEQKISVKEIPEKMEDINSDQNQEYHGPTRITYEFLEAPYNRKPVYLPVPVYKCRGDGVVEVAIQVDLSGKVISAKPRILDSPSDGQCLAEAAVKYALLSRFSKTENSPSIHRGKITYSFVAQ